MAVESGVMKIWWTTRAWPWLRENWRWVLFPIGILLLVGEVMARRGAVTTDPTAKADDRAAAEKAKRDADAVAAEASRARALTAEQEATKAKLAAVRQEHQEKLQALTADQMAHATTLEEDPEALNAFLRGL